MPETICPQCKAKCQCEHDHCSMTIQDENWSAYKICCPKCGYKDTQYRPLYSEENICPYCGEQTKQKHPDSFEDEPGVHATVHR